MGTEPFIGQVQPFAGTYAPRGWAFCAGQTLPISQNTTLYSLIGTYYGGDGVNSFNLPDLRGRAAVGVGRAPGSLRQWTPGLRAGQESVQMTTINMPSHLHLAATTLDFKVQASTQQATVHTPATGNALAAGHEDSVDHPLYFYRQETSNKVPLAGVSASLDVNVQPTGNGAPIENMQPWTAINYIIALEGVYPQRS